MPKAITALALSGKVDPSEVRQSAMDQATGAILAKMGAIVMTPKGVAAP